MFKALIAIIAVCSVCLAAPKTVVEKIVKADTVVTIKVDTIKTVKYDTIKVTKTLKDTSIVVKVDSTKVQGKSVIIK